MREQPPRVVFDCMIFLQAAARGGSPAGVCLELAERRFVQLYVSPAILAEVEDVLNRPQIRGKFRQLTTEVVAEFIAQIERIAIRVEEVPNAFTLARDPKDAPYVNLAIHCQADYLVSRDRDLLEGTSDVTTKFPRLRITDPVDFLGALRQRFGSSGNF